MSKWWRGCRKGPRTFHLSIDKFHLIKLINWEQRKCIKKYIHNIICRKFLGPRVNFTVIAPRLIFRHSLAKNQMRSADIRRISNWRIYNLRAQLPSSIPNCLLPDHSSPLFSPISLDEANPCWRCYGIGCRHLCEVVKTKRREGGKMRIIEMIRLKNTPVTSHGY